jgi:hypothetical protein
MDTEIKKEINKIMQLTDDLLHLFWGKLSIISISKGQHVFLEDQFCRHIAIIKKGAFYSYYLKNEKQIIEDFCFEACFIADYPSFIREIPIKKNFIALENSELFLISKTDLEGLYKLDYRFEKSGRLVAEFLFTSWEQKVRDLILKTPFERYNQLMKERNEVLQRVPQYLIASFLNITPEYLSQLRGKIVS